MQSPLALASCATRGFGQAVAVATICLFASLPLSAQQVAPSLRQVLREGMIAGNALNNREKKEQGASFDGYMVRGLMTFALLGSGQRRLVDGLFSDATEKKRIVALSEGLLVEFTGQIPTIKPGTGPLEEAVQRQTIAMSLAKRGDFKAALEQIAAFPLDESANALAVRSYLFVIDRQLDKQDIAGARRVSRITWSSINKLKDSRPKAERLIDLARSAARAGEQETAKRICSSAEDMLKRLPATADADPREANYSLRRLAVAHAMSGNFRSARAVLADYTQRAGAIKDPSDEADRMSEMEIAHARVAALANEKERALQAYARALEWAVKINHDAVTKQGDALDESGFLSILIALGSGATFRTVALGQLDVGDEQAALATLERMPMCLQKPATLLEMAKRLHKQGATAEARKLAEQCAELGKPDGPIDDVVTITAFVANIYRAIGDDASARRTIKTLVRDPRLNQSPAARKRTAGELADFGLFAESYRLIQTIESPADRALPLAKLAETMVKTGHK